MIKPLYKAIEPYMDVPNGHGHQGVLMYDEDNDKVQCHVCGGWFTSVGSHASRAHKIDSDSYKMKYGFTLRSALCSKELSKKRREIAETNEDKMRIGYSNVRLGNSKVRHCRPREHGMNTMQLKNLRGVCDKQIQARYEVVKNIVGKLPTSIDLEKYDHKLLAVIRRTHKGINAWRRKNGYHEILQNKRILSNGVTDLELVAILRRWHIENGRKPRAKDFLRAANGYPSCKSFYTHFGSWKSALCYAGL